MERVLPEKSEFWPRRDELLPFERELQPTRAELQPIHIGLQPIAHQLRTGWDFGAANTKKDIIFTSYMR